MKENYRNKNVLILGGLGMIGSSIANKLVHAGASVTVADAMLKDYGANFFNIEPNRDRIEFKKLDIRNRDGLGPLLKEKEILFSLAGQVSHNDSIKDPFLDAEINYLGHLNVLETAIKWNPKLRILYSGSRLQYGPIERIPVKETHPQNPMTPYSLNKQAAENLYLFYHRVYQLPVTCLRISNPYGPRGQMKHFKYGIVNRFIREAMENRAICIYGDGNQLRDYIYIDDLVDLMINAAIADNTVGEVFNAGSGTGTAFKEMAETIVEKVGKGRVEFVPWPAEYINVETGDYISDISKIRSHIHWVPKTDLQTGIRKTVEYYSKNIKEYIGQVK